jgi:hypothetical protein
MQCDDSEASMCSEPSLVLCILLQILEALKVCSGVSGYY